MYYFIYFMFKLTKVIRNSRRDLHFSMRKMKRMTLSLIQLILKENGSIIKASFFDASHANVHFIFIFREINVILQLIIFFNAIFFFYISFLYFVIFFLYHIFHFWYFSPLKANASLSVSGYIVQLLIRSGIRKEIILPTDNSWNVNL